MQITNVIIGTSVVVICFVIAISFAIEESEKDDVLLEQLQEEVQEELRDEIYPDEIIEEREDGTITFQMGGRLYSI